MIDTSTVVRDDDEFHVTYEDVYVRAMRPSQWLLDMRSIWNGENPTTHGARTAKEMKEKDAVKFSDRYQKAEETWREQVMELSKARNAAQVPESGTCADEDAGSDRCEELLDRLLKDLGR